ncbi:unnamed protein product [Rotaria sp. Silwood2]|nr:unnamed protein product [Rotaria sp. Silwood2]CAF2978291.1 unnamed protein product [Rotaria sp. Silwood2]CAF3277099.1 unnamed protein product [Rotaria sp. Silwood2]CAF3283629.1 unnamed protein product [Rotaria sp. Silwood2]CAF4060069.1 unnamed protein product [Rotaria sp. Silwood2]
MTLAGLLNDILSVIKFNSEVLRQTACYIYLLSSSINTSIMIIVFALKFLILIIAQMTYIKNRLFLYVQCRSLDFLLRIGLNMDQWLSVCVAIERTIIVLKRTHFNRNKSKQLAKYIILILLLLTISKGMHDPFH